MSRGPRADLIQIFRLLFLFCFVFVLFLGKNTIRKYRKLISWLPAVVRLRRSTFYSIRIRAQWFPLLTSTRDMILEFHFVGNYYSLDRLAYMHNANERVHPGQYSSGSECVLGGGSRALGRWRRRWRFFISFHPLLTSHFLIRIFSARHFFQNEIYEIFFFYTSFTRPRITRKKTPGKLIIKLPIVRQLFVGTWRNPLITAKTTDLKWFVEFDISVYVCAYVFSSCSDRVVIENVYL